MGVLPNYFRTRSARERTRASKMWLEKRTLEEFAKGVQEYIRKFLQEIHSVFFKKNFKSFIWIFSRNSSEYFPRSSFGNCSRNWIRYSVCSTSRFFFQSFLREFLKKRCGSSRISGLPLQISPEVSLGILPRLPLGTVPGILFWRFLPTILPKENVKNSRKIPKHSKI